MKQNLKRNNYMISLIKYKLPLYINTIFLNILLGIMPLIEGVVIKELFDFFDGSKSSVFNATELIILIGIIAIVNVIIIDVFYRQFSFHNFNINTLLKRNMLHVILKKHGGKAIHTSVGEVINSFKDDVNQIETSINWLASVIGQIIRALLAIIILMYINAKIALLVIIPLIIVIRIAQASEKNVEKNREEGRKATGLVNGTIGEIFESILSIKVFGASKNILNHLKKLNNRRYKTMIKDTLAAQFINSIYDNVNNVGTGLILLLVAGAINSGNFTVGDFSIFVYYLAYITDSIESFGNFMVFFKQTKVSYKNILNQVSIEETPEELVKYKDLYLKSNYKNKEEIEGSFKGISSADELNTLTVKGLTYLYNQSQNGVKDINFVLKRGEILVIAGRIGSGKTTLVKALIGLLPNVQGEVCWNDEKVENLKDFFVPPISAYTSQVPNLFSDTVKNNILLGLPQEDVDLKEAIKASVFEKDLKELDNGINTIIGTKGTKLSGGQIQRVAAARMFVRKSQLYIFDDISSALDIETEKTLWNRLFSQSNVTCIVVSNRRTILEKANNILFMKNGSVEVQGTFDELLESTSDFSEIVS